jgi:phytoene dehydrogenase-like protein
MRTVRGRSDHVVVVGAGLAGLSAALYLAGRGRRVTVVEREAWPGGRAGRLEIDGYRIDTGPTVLTMPDIIDDVFAAVGESRTDRLELLPVNPPIAPSLPTAPRWTSTPTRSGWSQRSRTSPAPTRLPATGGCGTG